MGEILCSTGALIGKSNNRDYRLLEPLSQQLKCDGFEFMMYRAWYEEGDELIQALKSMKLNIPVMHCEKSVGEKISIGGEEETALAYRLFEVNCKIAQQIGAGAMVLHLWGGHASDGNFQNNINAYPNLVETARTYGLDLLVENVVCNRENPMKHMVELRELYPDIHFVYDTKMAAFHEQTDLLYQKEYEWLWKDGHIRHYHVNDYAGGYMDWANLKTLAIGKGHVDFEHFFEYIRKIGYAGNYTIEATAFNSGGAVDVEMINEQVAYIKTKM